MLEHEELLTLARFEILGRITVGQGIDQLDLRLTDIDQTFARFALGAGLVFSGAVGFAGADHHDAPWAFLSVQTIGRTELGLAVAVVGRDRLFGYPHGDVGQAIGQDLLATGRARYDAVVAL